MKSTCSLSQDSGNKAEVERLPHLRDHFYNSLQRIGTRIPLQYAVDICWLGVNCEYGDSVPERRRNVNDAVCALLAFQNFWWQPLYKRFIEIFKTGFLWVLCRNLYILQKKQRCATFQATTVLSHQYMTHLDSTAHSIRFIMTWSSDLVVFLFVRQTLKLDTVSKVCRMLRIVLKLVTQTVSLQR